MSETNEIAALKKERDALAIKAKSFEDAAKKSDGEIAALKKERDEHKSLAEKANQAATEAVAGAEKLQKGLDASNETLLDIHAALGIEDDGDPLAAVEALLSTPVPLDGGGKSVELFKPEEKGTRRYGSAFDADRFIAIEEIGFTQDLGYHFDVIARRAESMVGRCVKAAGTHDTQLGRLPDFTPDRVLLVTVEVK
jgi:hypothetical protein